MVSAVILAAIPAVLAAPSLAPRATNTCGSAAVDGLVGFAAGTTGGSGTATVVTSCSAFTAAAKKGGVIQIKGTLSGCGIVDLVSNTSLLGVGKDAGITLGGVRVKKASNVIIRNIKFFKSQKGDDLLALDKATKVWIDHCDFSNSGLTGDKDYHDGMLDITHASDDITISWNKFHDHWKGSLVSHSDNNGSEDKGKLKVTYHHNYWNNVNSRAPSVRFGTAHVYSSCYEKIGSTAVNSRMGANVLVENSSFTDAKYSIVTNQESKEEGFAAESGNLFKNAPKDITKKSTWKPSYKYTLDKADCVCSAVKAAAGVGIIA